MAARSTVLLIAAIGLLPQYGCVAPSGRPLFGLHWPELWNPGTLDQQRNNAALNDPYADAYAGPAYDDTRPREFGKPLPEPVRNRKVYEQQTGS